jgi:hypothetical protein
MNLRSIAVALAAENDSLSSQIRKNCADANESIRRTMQTLDEIKAFLGKNG